MARYHRPGNPSAPRPRPRRWRWAMGAGAVLLSALAGGLFLLYPMRLSLEAAEHPVEDLTEGVWALAALLCVVITLRRGTTWRDRMSGGVLLALAVLALAREADLHLLLEPESMGPLGVDLKTTWWLEPSIPLWLKVAWTTALTIPVVALVIMSLMARAPMGRLLRAGDPSTIMLVVAGCLLAGGYACDEFLRDATFVSDVARTRVEEWLEFLGAAAFAASAGFGVLEPLSRRVAALEAPAGEPQPTPDA